MTTSRSRLLSRLSTIQAPRALLALGLCSCAASFPMTVSTNKPLAPKPPTCEFRVVAMPPATGYEELATLRLGFSMSTDPDYFKQAVRSDVCRVGGDLVVTELNGQGGFVRGVVLRRTM